MSEFKYRAFLSYSHTDSKWGDWLHKALETYRVPSRLVGKESRDGRIPARLFPIFRDREELPVSADLPSNINEALRDSRYLIVVCSPRSAQSRWVGEEIKAFKKLGREDRILAMIVDGEPNASDGKIGFASEDECFPVSMRYRLGADGRLSSERTEPIAADAREGKDGKKNAKLKLIAGLLCLNYDDLKQREQERKVRRARAIGLSSLFLVAVFAALAVALFFKEREARSQQVAAERARGEAQAQQVAADNARKEARKQQVSAEQARDAASATLSRSDMLQALRSIGDDKDLDGLAQLARSLRFDPTNQNAACRLATLLAYREYPTLVLRLKHEAKVSGVSFSPDGNTILTIAGKEVRVCDARTGRPQGNMMMHDDFVNSAQFSPDGRRILTGIGRVMAENGSFLQGFGEVRIWDVHTGRTLIGPMKYGNQVRTARYSSDGRRFVVAVASGDEKNGEAEVRDAQSGELITTLVKYEAVRFADFSPDSTRVATVSSSIQVWDAKNGTRLSESKEPTGIVSYSARFSPDGKQILTAFMSGAQIWDAQTGRQLLTVHASGRFASAQLSPDGTKIATSGCPRDGPCITTLWDAKTGEQLGGSVTGDDPQFSPDGKHIVVISGDQGRIWDAGWADETGSLQRRISNFGKPVSEPMKFIGAVSAQFSPDGRWVLIGAGKEALLWDTHRGAALSEPIKDLGLASAQFSRDGKRVLTLSNNENARRGTVHIWDTATGMQVGTIELNGLLNAADFSSDDAFVMTVQNAELPKGTHQWPVQSGVVAQLWDAKACRAAAPPIGGYLIARFSRDGKTLLTASRSEVSLRSSHTGHILKGPTKWDFDIFSAELSPDARWVLTLGATKTGLNRGQLWDTATGKLTPIDVGNLVAVDFSPDGKVLALVSDDQIRVFEMETDQLLGQTTVGGDYTVGTIRFSPDGKYFATAGKFETRIWESGTLKPITERIRDFSVISFSTHFSPDSKRVLLMHIWDAETGKQLTDAMRDESQAWGAQFNPTGTQILTISAKQARVWDVMPATPKVPEWLPLLAEATALQRLNDHSAFERITEDQEIILQQLRNRLEGEPTTDWVRWGRWFLADRSTRSISPFSKVTIREYIHNRIEENTSESLEEAERLALGNAELISRIVAARKAFSRTATP